MSAVVLDFAPRAAAPRVATSKTAPQPRLRLTRRGRVVFTTLAALPLVFAAMFFVLNGGGAVATNGSEPLETVTVSGGQTLWSIAESVAPDSDPRDFIADVMSINELGTSLVAGQELLIPAKYSE